MSNAMVESTTVGEQRQRPPVPKKHVTMSKNLPHVLCQGLGNVLSCRSREMDEGSELKHMLCRAIVMETFFVASLAPSSQGNCVWYQQMCPGYDVEQPHVPNNLP